MKAEVKVRLADRPWVDELTKTQLKKHLLAAVKECSADALIASGELVIALENGLRPDKAPGCVHHIKKAMKIRDRMYQYGEELVKLEPNFDIAEYAIPFLGEPGNCPVNN